MEINNASKLTEKFSADFQKFLTPENIFFYNTKGETSSDISVNIPQFLTQIAGPTDPTSDDALDVVKWANDNKVVTQKRFRTKAYQIADFEEFFTAQDQRMNAMEAMQDFIQTSIGNYAAYKFASDTNIVQTTGTSTRTSSVIGSSATVKKITEADMIAVHSAMAKFNMPGKWYAVLSPDQIADLLEIGNFTTADKTGINSKLLSGEFAEILGIRIFQRQANYGANVAFDSVGTPGTLTKMDIYGAVGAASAITATMQGAGIFWNENALYQAKGLAKAYVESSAIYQSDILSLNYTFGVEPIRNDGKGLVTLVEAV